MKSKAGLKLTLLAATALAVGMLSQPAAAQTDAQIDAIEKQIKALQQELSHVKADLAARDRALRAAQDQAKAAQEQAKAAQSQAATAAVATQQLQQQVATAPPAPPPAPPTPPLPPGTFRVGGVTVTLGGFAAAEGVFRSRNEGASIDTNFNGNIPFPNSPNYYVGEFRETAQQSRFSLQAQGWASDSLRLTSYMETDFLSAGSSSNNNQSNSYTLRLRQFWGSLDDMDDGWHFLGGQAWSLATQYRVGLVPRQENVPLTIDAQYVVGFDWERQAQLRLAKDFDDHRIWAGLSLEEPQTIYGSTAGPNCLTGANTLTAAGNGTLEYTSCGGPNVNSIQAYSDNIAPDIIGKLAADPGFGHYELWGLVRWLGGRVSPPSANGTTGSNHWTTGEGIGANALMPLLPGMLDFQVSGLVGQGVGRYGSAQIADVTFTPSGVVKAIPEYSVMGGFVGHPLPSIDIYAYGGAEGASRKWYDVDGVNSGYGNPNASLAGCVIELGSCSANTSEVVEGTIGGWWRFLKGSYGTMQAGLQYEWIGRSAFSGAGATKGTSVSPYTNMNAFLFSFRYLPFQ